MPGTVLGFGETARNKADRILTLHSLCSQFSLLSLDFLIFKMGLISNGYHLWKMTLC